MQAHFILDEEEEVEDEKRSRWRTRRRAGGGRSARSSSPPLSWSGSTLEEVAAAAAASFPQSPLGVCPSPCAGAFPTLKLTFPRLMASIGKLKYPGSSRLGGGDRPLV